MSRSLTLTRGALLPDFYLFCSAPDATRLQFSCDAMFTSDLDTFLYLLRMNTVGSAVAGQCVAGKY